MNPDASGGYGRRPCYPELAAIVLIGLLHVVSEVVFSARVAGLYIGGAALVFVGYFIWRIRRSPGALRVWGFRRDNFWLALRAQLGFVAVGAIVLLGYGALSGSIALPGTFWLTVGLYPVWGLGQQFALQNLIARNLTGLFSSSIAIAMSASVLFAASHYPQLQLVLLTFAAGVPFTLIHRRHPNLWAVGIAHGILGALAVHIVLGIDPGAYILDFIFDR